MEDITIHTETIQLDQFLKWAGAAESGGQVKEMVSAGMVSVNGVTVSERRKKLQPGDVVVVKDYGSWKVAGA
ncbi:MAG: RNA-binding S4 domain-containing protein [Sporomusaceae bacterium]|nr:RNA-binding S4 domain-containing protein [Sporomusaceae bacterium]